MKQLYIDTQLKTLHLKITTKQNHDSYSFLPFCIVHQALQYTEFASYGW